MMRREEFLKLIGSRPGTADYVPVACLLKTGYACAGYYNSPLNDEFQGLCVLANVRLLELRPQNQEHARGAIQHFYEFIEDIAVGLMQSDAPELEQSEQNAHRYGRSIPLAAIPFDEIAIVYPVAQISSLLRRIEEDAEKTPSFLDFDRKSVVLRVLRTRIF